MSRRPVPRATGEVVKASTPALPVSALPRRPFVRRTLLALAGAALLGGCGTSQYQPPRGIGTHPSDLKASPCACLEIPLGDDAASRRRFLDRVRDAVET